MAKKKKKITEKRRISKNARQSAAYNLAKMGFNKATIDKSLEGYDKFMEPNGNFRYYGKRKKLANKAVLEYALSNLGITKDDLNATRFTYQDIRFLIKDMLANTNEGDSDDTNDPNSSYKIFTDTFGEDALYNNYETTYIKATDLKKLYKNISDKSLRDNLEIFIDMELKNRLRINQ